MKKNNLDKQDLSFYVKNGERLEDLLIKDYKILQNDNKYKFSRDSVLLADFCEVKKGDFVVDLCSGCGIIAFLIKTKNLAGKIVGIDIDAEFVDMANRTKLYNKMEDIEFVCGDVKNIEKYFQKGRTDVVVCNPPYYKDLPTNTTCLNALAKYEVELTLQDLMSAINKILKSKGKLFMCYPFSRLQELCCEAGKNNLFLKTMEFIPNSNNKNILVKFVKNGKMGVKLQ